MKLIELEIYETRGIRELRLQPNGNNMVVWGPNGAGKSAVVDAIDFLMTGRISRLRGKGTSGITLSKHGPHVDHEPAEAIVKAVIELPGAKKRVTLQRCMASPNSLEIQGNRGQTLDRVLELAKRGQHVLTRREILRYITAEGGTRAEEIQELLDLKEVEEIRKALIRVTGEFEKALTPTRGQLAAAKGAVIATTRQAEYRPSEVLAVVDQLRDVLGGQPIDHLAAENLKSSLTPPTAAPSTGGKTKTLLRMDLQSLRDALDPQRLTTLEVKENKLRTTLNLIRSNPDLLRDLARAELTQKGLELLDDTSACPLCDAEWPPGELRDRLEQRLGKTTLATQYNAEIASLASSLSQTAMKAIAELSQMQQVADTAGLPDATAAFQRWRTGLQEIGLKLTFPVRDFGTQDETVDSIVAAMSPAGVQGALDAAATAIDAAYPESTPELDAWTTLTRLEENLKALQRAEAELAQAEQKHRAALALSNGYVRARDTVLQRLYGRIKDRFVELYRELHGEDEGRFDARLEPEGAGLILEVDFRGRGTHQPQALHSEGHQDSMGLCLYLALAEQLGQGLVQMIVLDDVVMSVDADHRRSLCSLLASQYANYQFIITTHDRTWASQLKAEGVVKSREYAEFYNWHVDTGPLVNCEADLWDRIEADLGRNDVSAAAARLRRGSEEFFAAVCDGLKAPVAFKLNGRWELGDFMPAAIGRYRELIKKAKQAVQSWADEDIFQMLQELDSTSASIITRTQAEQWAVNANVHYNNWANFQTRDFLPLVEAFQDLYGLFVCSRCGAMLRIASEGPTPVTVRCGCGQVNWNLTSKPRMN